MPGFYDRLYQWTNEKAAQNKALWALALVSFLESAILPIPIEIITIPLFLGNPKKVLRVAMIASLSSVLGGIIGYLIGSFFYDSLGRYLIEFYGFEKEFFSLKDQFRNMGWFVVFIGGLTPLPYKIICVASGVTKLNFLVFFSASFASRSLRFLAFALVFHLFGEKMKIFIEQNSSLVSFVVLFCLVGGFVLMFWMP